MKICALVLIILALGGFFFATKEKVAAAGAIDISGTEARSESISLAGSLSMLAAGGIMLAVSSKRAA